MKALFFRIFFWWLEPFDIKREGESRVYLRRFHIAKNRFFQVYIHNIRLPDDDPDPHDHPWSFLTLVLKGGYTDESWFAAYSILTTASPNGTLVSRSFEYMIDRTPDVLRRGSIRFRKAEHIHRVRDVQPNTWTIVFGGPIQRVWGFWKRDSARWVAWRKYLGIPEGTEYKGD